MIFDATLWSIVAPALVAALLVAATHVPLGIEVLKRGIIFIDLATAQIAGLGAVAATLYFGEADDWQGLLLINASAVAAALASGAFFAWSERHLPDYEEALIGSAFVLAAAMALLILANQPMGGEEMKDLLAGQILWTDWSRNGLIAAIYAPIMIIWFGFRERLGRVGFYMVFAVAITTSVQIVGVYLVFASLIFPALGTSLAPPGRRLVMAYMIAALGILAGLILSVISDTPTGPTLVWSLAAVAILGALLLSPLRQQQ